MRTAAFATLSLVFALIDSVPAHAANGEAQLGLGVGLGSGFVEPTLVTDADIDLWVGINDWIWLGGAGHFAWLPQRSHSGFRVLAGGALSLDVFKWVPWLDVMGGIAGDDLGRISPSARVSLGADYWLDFKYAVGGWIRTHITSGRLGGTQLLGGLRFVVRWEP